MKATLIFEDTDDGNVNIKLEFDPVAKMDENMTPATYMATKALKQCMAEDGEIMSTNVEGT